MPATLTLSGKKFVVLSEDEYLSSKKKAMKTSGERRTNAKGLSDQDAGDIAEAKRRLKDPKRIPAEEVFKRLGV